jgi:hypothetical protein
MQEKPDQHVTRISRSVCIWSEIIHISRGQCIVTFHVVVNRVERGHCSQEKGFRHNLQHASWPICGSIPSFSLKIANEALGAKPIFYWRPATRLTGPISSACDRYVQYLLARDNSLILNWHRRGLQPPKGPAQSPVIQSQLASSKIWYEAHIAKPWPFDHPASTKVYIYAQHWLTSSKY